ncbi:MAG: acetyl-CoA carboxylase biotin carboxyl carrier protein [Saprospiraceae bacterium]|jgi:acetyl-CoA carboxylase biotin carboxyl carrier protein
MTFQEITELIKTISRSRLAEFKLKDGDFELSIKTDRYGDTKATKVVQTPIPVAAPQPIPATAASAAAPAPAAAESAPKAATEAPPAPAPAKGQVDESKYLKVKSPMVGTFYRSGSPEKPAYVEIGQSIKKGDVVCIIEAMKLFNEIEAEVSGKVVKVLVDNAKPVEYDQVLFLVEPE